MIIAALIALFVAVVWAILSLLPTGTAGPWDFGGLSMPSAIVDQVFPWEHFIAAVGVLLGWAIICHGYRIVLWLLGLVHIAGNSEG